MFLFKISQYIVFIHNVLSHTIDKFHRYAILGSHDEGSERKTDRKSRAESGKFKTRKMHISPVGDPPKGRKNLDKN